MIGIESIALDELVEANAGGVQGDNPFKNSEVRGGPSRRTAHAAQAAAASSAFFFGVRLNSSQISSTT